MNALSERFEDTFQFLACYFTEDLSEEFGEPEAAVEKYISDSTPVLRATVVKQLRQLLVECDESELNAAIFELGCYYRPQKHRGITMTAWIEQVAVRLEESLTGTNKT
jgi:hypothetical protein